MNNKRRVRRACQPHRSRVACRQQRRVHSWGKGMDRHRNRQTDSVRVSAGQFTPQRAKQTQVRKGMSVSYWFRASHRGSTQKRTDWIGVGITEDCSGTFTPARTGGPYSHTLAKEDAGMVLLRRIHGHDNSESLHTSTRHCPQATTHGVQGLRT